MQPKANKHFSSSILLWMRADRPRQVSMDYWRGPHSQIIAATPGFDEYRQIHLAEDNPGLWPATAGVETAIPADRRVDGLAEVTFRSALGPLMGRKQTRMAYKDEVNVFRRTLLYGGLPGWSRWYDVAPPRDGVGARTIVYLRKRDDVGGRAFRSFINKELAPALAGAAVLTELRTQTFLPWFKGLWNTPNVAHDNPMGQRFSASLMLGFRDEAARAAFYGDAGTAALSARIGQFSSAVHAYNVASTLTFVRDGARLPSYEVT